MPVVSVATSPDAIEALARPWSRLARESASATPFQSDAWLLPWMHHMRIEEPCVVVVREGTDVVGLAPLFARRHSPGRTFALLGAGVSDRLDLLAAPGFEDAATEALGEWLDGEQASWDACVFEELGPRALLRDVRPPPGRSRTLVAQSVCPVLVLSPSSRGWGGGVPASQWPKLRKNRRRAETLGAFTLERADRTGPIAALEVLFALHAKRWEQRGEAGVLADPAVRALHRDAALRFGARGELRIYVASIGGRPAAVVYGMRRGPRLYLYLNGIEPELERASPGTLALGGAIEDAMAEGVTEVDFLRGNEAYKYAWGAVDEINVCLTLA
ncbi:MAG: GNAT family N-acetyltransferase [Polyangiaceae bacterium]|nr:GNAT family N-acetyltransferase [Polyangiaceae bacterium]